MKQLLHIAVADQSEPIRSQLAEMLRRLGHEVPVLADSGVQLIDDCQCYLPDLLFIEATLPDMEGIQAAGLIQQSRPTPVILLSHRYHAGLTPQVDLETILGFLIKPIRQVDLAPAISVAMHRFRMFQNLVAEIDRLRQDLQ